MAQPGCVVSAGAFDSPKLLLLSGIGGAEHLQPLGIPVVVDREHPGFVNIRISVK
ncbi:MAG TPA: GMC family oxidoreductase N-terminal domain-containing protein [Phototrophicaceae bacterium]|nr:GMC family oxidoreductase N-terminal domain-containing protein [Phototrophicaceae bacterium]